MKDAVIVTTAAVVVLFVSLPWACSPRYRAEQFAKQRFGYGSLKALRRDGRGARGFFTWGTFLALIGYSGAARALAVLTPGARGVWLWVADILIGATVVFLVLHVTTILTGKPAVLVRTPHLATPLPPSPRRSAAARLARARRDAGRGRPGAIR